MLRRAEDDALVGMVSPQDLVMLWRDGVLLGGLAFDGDGVVSLGHWPDGEVWVEVSRLG